MKAKVLKTVTDNIKVLLTFISVVGSALFFLFSYGFEIYDKVRENNNFINRVESQIEQCESLENKLDKLKTSQRTNKKGIDRNTSEIRENKDIINKMLLK